MNWNWNVHLLNVRKIPRLHWQVLQAFLYMSLGPGKECGARRERDPLPIPGDSVMVCTHRLLPSAWRRPPLFKARGVLLHTELHQSFAGSVYECWESNSGNNGKTLIFSTCSKPPFGRGRGHWEESQSCWEAKQKKPKKQFYFVHFNNPSTEHGSLGKPTPSQVVLLFQHRKTQQNNCWPRWEFLKLPAKGFPG